VVAVLVTLKPDSTLNVEILLALLVTSYLLSFPDVEVTSFSIAFVTGISSEFLT